MSARQRALRASGWVLGAMPAGMILQLVRNLILTRLLAPEVFGLMVLVTLVMQGLQQFSDLGIGPAIIQHPRGDDPRFLKTAWTLSILRGLGLWLMCCVLAWPAAVFYDEPALLLLLPAAGFSPVIGGFGTTAGTTLARRMIRGKLTVLGFANQIIGFVVVVVLAVWLRNVWALVLGSLLSGLISVVMGHLFLPGISHRFHWEPRIIRELTRFGGWIFLSTLLGFFAMHVDRMVLGKLVPMDVLGVYGIAMIVASQAGAITRTITQNVLFPVMAEKHRTSTENLQRHLDQARGLVLQAAMLLTFGVMAISPGFFMGLYDSRYHAAAWISQCLVVAGWFGILEFTGSRILLALGDSRALFIGNVLNLLVTVPAVLLGYYWFGIEGFILGYGLGTFAGHIYRGIRLRAYHLGMLRGDGRLTLIVLAGFAMLINVQWYAAAYTNHMAVTTTVVGMAGWLVVAVIIGPRVIRETMPNLAAILAKPFGRLVFNRAHSPEVL